jgi:hypothetical protein
MSAGWWQEMKVNCKPTRNLPMRNNQPARE